MWNIFYKIVSMLFLLIIVICVAQPPPKQVCEINIVAPEELIEEIKPPKSGDVIIIDPVKEGQLISF